MSLPNTNHVAGSPCRNPSPLYGADGVLQTTQPSMEEAYLRMVPKLIDLHAKMCECLESFDADPACSDRVVDSAPSTAKHNLNISNLYSPTSFVDDRNPIDSSVVTMQPKEHMPIDFSRSGTQTGAQGDDIHVRKAFPSCWASILCDEGFVSEAGETRRRPRAHPLSRAARAIARGPTPSSEAA